MNPKDHCPNDWRKYAYEYDDVNDQLDHLEAELLRKKAEMAKIQSDAANKALNDLCAALGVDLPGVSINGGTGHLSIPTSQVQLIADRITVMKEANVLIEGAL